MAQAKCVKCAEKCGKNNVNAEILDTLETQFQKFLKTPSNSLLKKYLSVEVFDKIKNNKTSFGSTLLDCVQSGFENPDSGIGIYAPDAEAYILFADIFDPIIEDYHTGFNRRDKHPLTDFGNINSIANVDPANQFVVSTRIRCGRSVEGYPFNPCLSEKEYQELEEKIIVSLKSLTGELAGQYYPLSEMADNVRQKLADDHFLFQEGDRFLQSANACRFWPKGRGIFHNSNKTFLVWVNEEDHIRIICMQSGGDIGGVYRRFVKAVTEIETKIKFSRDNRLGYLTFCPTNLEGRYEVTWKWTGFLVTYVQFEIPTKDIPGGFKKGTAIRASVHIKLPKLTSDKKKLNALADKYNLQIRGSKGEHTATDDGIYDISNKRRLGLTEFQAIKEMEAGIVEIIKYERGMK